MKSKLRMNWIILPLFFLIGILSKNIFSQVYISDFSDFPAYPYNTTSYKQNNRFVGCGPTTGAMILVYFDQANSLNNALLTNPGTGVNKGLNTAWALHASQYMNTQANGFGNVFNIKPGLEDYAQDMGYEIKVMIHASDTYYSDPNASSAEWLNDYGAYGDAWNNDGYFWRHSNGDWSIHADDFCDFLQTKLSAGVAVFLTIDTDLDSNGDHWVPLVGYNKSTGKYAFYNTYSTTVKWADIHYCNTPGAAKDNSISMLRTITYIGSIGDGTLDPPLNLIALDNYNSVIPLAWNHPSGPYQPDPGPLNAKTKYTERIPTEQEMTLMKLSKGNLSARLIGPLLHDEKPLNEKYMQSIHETTGLTGYHVYRSTSQSSGYIKIASNLTHQYYRDEDVNNGVTYYYKVTAVYNTGESDFSNDTNAQCQEDGYTLSSGWTDSPAIVDGVINTNEWSDAIIVDMTYPNATGPVTLYLMNDSERLYLAVDDQTDSQLDNLDQLAIFFDTNFDREWPSSAPSDEGNFWIAWDAAENHSFTLFGPRYGYWPDGLFWPERSTPVGITHAMTASSGNVQYEGAFDLSVSPFTGSPGDTLGFLLFAYDYHDTDFTSFWPQQAEQLKVVTPDIQFWGQAPFSFGDLILHDGVILDIPDAPTNLKAINLTDQIHITWHDNSDNETGFKLQVKETPGIAPIVWNDLATLSPNSTSFQMGNPIVGHTYTFRVAAFNDDGMSSYSEEVSISRALLLSWITIESPNGGEEWGTGYSYPITWESGSMNPPSHVDIFYSTDGGSHWITPAIATNVSNAGIYNWTIPNTSSTNCKVKIKNSTGAYPYDISNASFTISDVVPTPILVVNPTTLNFVETDTELTFDIGNDGDGSLTWMIITSPGKDWIASVTPFSGSNSGTITVTVDRSLMIGNSDVGYLEVSSNGGSETITINISKPVVVQLPSHWQFTESTGNSATIVLPTSINPSVEGTLLQNGDYIGLFTSSGLCCGYNVWMGENISITAWGNDDQTSSVDGFSAGEEIQYRVYRPSELKEWETVHVSYSQGTGKYASDGFLILSQFDVIESITMTLNLTAEWNMFSIHVIPDDPVLETVMNPIDNSILIMKNTGGQAYIPAYQINAIGSINYLEGYQIYLTSAEDLDVMGEPADPETPIDLSVGWQIISYLPDTPMSIESALTSINSHIIIVKNNAGQNYIPEYAINTIGDMQPGQGYQIYLEAQSTLTYPAGSGAPQNTTSLAKENRSELLLNHFSFTENTGENATLVVTTDANPRYSDGSPLVSGDEIGVFTTAGLCCGAVVWEGDNAAITVWGENSQTQDVDGFQAGDTLRIRVWRQSSHVEYLGTVTLQVGHSIEYQANGFSVVTDLIVDLTSDVTDKRKSLPSDCILTQNYPNPFNPETTITFQMPQSADVEITIFDILGNQIRRFPLGMKPSGEHKLLWNGKDNTGSHVSSGIYFYKLIVKSGNQSQVSMKKMMLLK